MKHYDYVEWILYKKELLNNRIREGMEEHLYLCDECMDTFLSLIDGLEMESAEKLIPGDFTDKVMGNLRNIKPMKIKSIKNKPKLTNDFFLYYSAVASVAIILTAGGFFGKLVDSVPEITASISIQEEKIAANTIFKFSEEVTKRTSIFINDFQINRNKED